MSAQARCCSGRCAGYHLLAEAYELVEDGLITDEDFREFVFTNPLHFWADENPNFFKGTVLESDANQALATSSSS